MDFLKNSQRSYLLLGQLLSILVIFSVISCDCNKDKDLEERISGSIIMHVPTNPLLGDSKTAEISFMLADSTTIALLENFTLQVNLQKDNSGSSSKISYKDSTGALQETDKVDISLKSLSKNEHLTAAEPSFEVPFTLVPHLNSEELTAEFKLVSKDGKPASTGSVNWKKDNKAVGLFLSRTSADKIKGDNKTISLKIENKETQAIQKGQLKLKIVRTQGNTASIQGATQVGGANVYTIDLPPVKPNSSLPYDLTIVPKDDQQATFSIQLQREGISIGNAVIASWEKGLVIQVEHDRKTNDVKVFVTNTGTETAKDVKLTYDTKISNAKIGEATKNEKVLKDLNPGEKREVKGLGKLDFGKDDDGNDNMAATCEFGISCASSCPINPQTTVVVKEVFTRLDIVLSLAVNYDIEKSQVNYIIRNLGENTAEGLKLKYENISTDEEGKLATLDTKQSDTITLGDLVGKQEFNRVLSLDLKDAEAARFNFSLEYNNKSMAETIEEFQAKPLNLSLGVISSEQYNGEHYILYGAANQFKFKIDQVPNSRPINRGLLKVIIKKEANDTSFISKVNDGEEITELLGNDLVNLGDEITLYVNPAIGVQEANFTFLLMYKDKEVSQPLSLQWREYVIRIKNRGRLVGQQEGSVTLSSVSSINLDALTVTLESDNDTSFKFLKLDNTNSSSDTRLVELSDYTDINRKNETKPIRFKVDQANNQAGAQVNIIVKRGETELARGKVDWVTQGISLQVTPDIYSFSKKSREITITVKNTGDTAIDLRKIKVGLTSTSNTSFRLGNASGSSILETMSNITAEKELASQAHLTISLGVIDALLDKEIVTGINLSILDNSNSDLYRTNLLYYMSKIDEVEESIEALIGKYGILYSQSARAYKDDPGYFMNLLLVLQNGIEAYKELLDKYEEVIDVDPNFQPIINLSKTVSSDKLKKWEVFAIQAQKTIANWNDSTLAALTWLDNKSKEAAIIHEQIRKNIEIIQASQSNLGKIRSLLIAKHDKGKGLNEQSIKALYLYYKQIIDIGKGLLDEVGIKDVTSNDEDSVTIKQIKDIYNKISTEFIAIDRDVQEAFDIGSEVFKKGMVSQQEAVHPDKGNKESKLGLYTTLEFHQELLVGWKDMVKDNKDGLGVERSDVYDFVVQRYQVLVEKTEKLVTETYSKKHAGYVYRGTQIVLKTAEDIYKMALINKNQVTKDAAITTLQLSIKVFNKLEQARNRRHTGKAEVLVFGKGKTLSLPDTYNLLKSRIENLKKQ